MTEALRALMAGLIDYAGLFPPAALEMADAQRKYASYAAGEHAWALGRFIVPAALVDEVDPSWRCSVIGMPSRVVDACEIKVASAHQVPQVMPGVIAYYELPITEDPVPLAGTTGSSVMGNS